MNKVWVLRPGFAQGAFWACLTACVGSLNDVIVRMVGARLDVIEVSFFRFFFSMLTLLPLLLHQGKAAFKTSHPQMHFWRAILGASALGLFTFSVLKMPLAEVTTMSFTQPIFVLVLAAIFLKEHVSKNRWLATIIGIIGGAFIILNPTESGDFNYLALLPMGAAFLFASLDILAKKMVSSESITTLLFYFALGTTLAALGPALYVWVTPTLRELLWLILLGVGANLIQVCLFKAFAATDASFLAPFRYVELLFATLFGFCFFSEIPTSHTLIGASIIIGSALFITYSEKKKS